ncbi:hypothetical protein, variant 1 [Exophiala mesophila]|uniref:FHA domain-containing protein n=2 Tax=Exophiala mesophila TaxID=212818 RepID=A0A0D1ZRJ0_EXOME|nr:hypothetical protein, variant 1 [Exophiala mesophila]KIV96539.1 hypothetical protein, variant 1 [Exophiala mesophila]
MAEGDLSATFILRNTDRLDTIPDRVIKLTAPDWQIKIGRGTTSGDQDLQPSKENAFFDSRVMSRHHAILTANPDNRQFIIEDIGSMHGTYCNSRRLKSNIPEPIYNGDTLVFGSDVTRGTSSFNALQVLVTAYWSDTGAPLPSSGWPVLQPRNTFSADYTDDDNDGDDHADIHVRHMEQDSHADIRFEGNPASSETGYFPIEDDDEVEVVEVVKESIRSPSVEVVIPPYNESIADSEYPDSDGAFSIDEPQSSPLATSDEDEAHKSAEAKFTSLDSPSDTLRITSTSYISHVERSDRDTVSMAHSSDESAVTNHVDADVARQSVQPRPATSGSHAPADIIMHDNSHVDQSYLAPPFAHDGLRAPSPSDAALAKPRPAVQDNQPFLRIDPFTGNIHPPTLPPLSRTGWAGHNSILYDPLPPPTTYSHPYPEHAHVVPFMYGTLEGDVMLSHDTGNDAKVRHYELQRSKRKAHEISGDEDHGASFTQASSSSDYSTRAVAGDEEEILPAEATIPVDHTSVHVEVEETGDDDPRKKVKIDPSLTQQHNRGKTFFKYAAATMAGFAIGTASTIVGLASLPQDYFS